MEVVVQKYGGSSLSTFAEVRAIQQNARNHHFADSAEQRARDQAMDENWGLRGQGWLFGYNALEEVGAR